MSAPNVTSPVSLLAPFTSNQNPASVVVLIPKCPLVCMINLVPPAGAILKAPL